VKSERNDNKSVAVILSTYNGAKYLRQQIDSILHQTYENITLFIRDDGSKDDTLNIICEYLENEYSVKIVLIEDGLGNVGFGESFCRIIAAATGYDYYAFCDQDDYWLENKIELAVEEMSKYDRDEYLLWTANYFVTDEKLEKRRLANQESPLLKLNLYNHCFHGLISGFSIVINNKLKEVAFGQNDYYPAYHDRWVVLIVLALKGKLLYSEEPLVFYRRYDGVTSSTEQPVLRKLIWRIKNVIKGSYLQDIRDSLTRFYAVHKHELTDEQSSRFFEIFTGTNFGCYLRRIFFPHQLRRTVVDEILLRVLFVFNKY